MPKISVIMSVKNGEAFVNKSIDSILRQTFRDFEFIICDDGSTDNTLEILKSYAQNDSRIVILNNLISKGLAYSLNKCIAAAKCEIIARQDADDFSSIDRFDRQYRFVLEHPEYSIIGTSWYNVDNCGRRLKENFPLRRPSAIDQVSGGSYMHPSWMMRKSHISRVGFYTVNQYTMRDQDYHLVMKILAEGMTLYNMQDILYNYTVDYETMTRSINWKRVPGLMWIRYDSYKRNKLPAWCYIYVFKPLLVHLMPRWMMIKHYNSVYAG